MKYVLGLVICMVRKQFKKGDFDEDCERFVAFKRDESYNLYDIVDTEKLDYVGFIVPYNDYKECERDCNIMNVVDYLLKELRG